jgi:hypothetical protein
MGKVHDSCKNVFCTLCTRILFCPLNHYIFGLILFFLYLQKFNNVESIEMFICNLVKTMHIVTIGKMCPYLYIVTWMTMIKLLNNSHYTYITCEVVQFGHGPNKSELLLRKAHMLGNPCQACHNHWQLYFRVFIHDTISSP